MSWSPRCRHVYCASIGYLGLHRNLDLNVAIRTAIVSQGQAHFAVGGGVVYDSQEEDEYEETLHKGRTLFRLIEGDFMKSQFVWLNDDLVPVDQARVSVNDRGFLYGDGFFETLRAEAGTVFFLREHLARLAASAVVFRLPFPGDLPWKERLARLLAANGLEEGIARVKIQLTRGVASGLGLPVATPHPWLFGPSRMRRPLRRSTPPAGRR